MDNPTQNQDGRTEPSNDLAGKAQPEQQPMIEGKNTQVNNAHAAGLGSMGRNDEKLPNEEEDENEQADISY